LQQLQEAVRQHGGFMSIATPKHSFNREKTSMTQKFTETAVWMSAGRFPSMGLLLVVLMGAGGCAIAPWDTPQRANTNVSRTAVPPGYYRVNTGDSLDQIAASYGRRTQDIVRWNGLADSQAIVPGQLLKVAPPVAASEPAAVAHYDAKDMPAKPRPADFIWPVQGRVISPFVTGKSRGVLIHATPGEPVRAAAAGRVVYAGTAIAAYGPLVIIRHNNGLVTAYAHNGRLLVKDNQAVTQGQSIAEVGSGQDGRSVLQFEVRRNGLQVNPLSLLPVVSTYGLR
jgi:lipoprotein NlpD